MEEIKNKTNNASVFSQVIFAILALAAIICSTYMFCLLVVTLAIVAVIFAIIYAVVHGVLELVRIIKRKCEPELKIKV